MAAEPTLSLGWLRKELLTTSPGQGDPGPPLGIPKSWGFSYLEEGLPVPPGPPGSVLTNSNNAVESVTLVLCLSPTLVHFGHRHLVFLTLLTMLLLSSH